MLVWETDLSLRDDELGGAFAEVWCAIPKVVFSRTLGSVQGNARLAEASVAEEVAAALGATHRDVSIGGAGLAAAAVELGLVDECACSAIRSLSVAARRSCRRSPKRFGWTWSRPRRWARE